MFKKKYIILAIIILYAFTDIAGAVGLSRSRGVYDTLAPTSGINPSYDLSEVRANLEKLDLTKDLQESWVFLYLSVLIGEVLSHSGNAMSPDALISYIENNLPIDASQHKFKGLRWNGLRASDNGGYLLPYVDESNGKVVDVHYFTRTDEGMLPHRPGTQDLGIGQVMVRCDRRSYLSGDDLMPDRHSSPAGISGKLAQLQAVDRSLLFCPGASLYPGEKGGLQKMRPVFSDVLDGILMGGLPGGFEMPDAIILDLEDSVDEESKSRAREQVKRRLEELKTCNFHKPNIIVRINAIDTTHWKKDLDMLKGMEFDGIMVPKVYSADDLRTINAYLVSIGKKDAIYYPIIERPNVDLLSFQECHDVEIEGLVLGLDDLTKSLGIGRTSKFSLQDLWPAIEVIKSVSLKRNFRIIGPVFNWTDMESANEEVELLHDMGFSGSLCIYPRQVEVLNEAFKTMRPQQDSYQGPVEPGTFLNKLRASVVSIPKLGEAWARMVLDGRSARVRGVSYHIDKNGRHYDTPYYNLAERILQGMDGESAYMSLDGDDTKIISSIDDDALVREILARFLKGIISQNEAAGKLTDIIGDADLADEYVGEVDRSIAEIDLEAQDNQVLEVSLNDILAERNWSLTEPFMYGKNLTVFDNINRESPDFASSVRGDGEEAPSVMVNDVLYIGSRRSVLMVTGDDFTPVKHLRTLQCANCVGMALRCVLPDGRKAFLLSHFYNGNIGPNPTIRGALMSDIIESTLDEVIEVFETLGGSREDMKATLVGGFTASGEQYAERIEKYLKAREIDVDSEHTGGGRDYDNVKGIGIEVDTSRVTKYRYLRGQDRFIPIETPPAPKPTKILHIEDYDSFAEAVSVSLTGKVGVSEVVRVRNLSEARAYIESEAMSDIGLIISDLQLPDGNADGLILGIKNGEYGETVRQIPCVMLTGKPKDISKEAREPGILAAILEKPTGPQELRVAVRRAMKSGLHKASGVPEGVFTHEMVNEPIIPADKRYTVYGKGDIEEENTSKPGELKVSEEQMRTFRERLEQVFHTYDRKDYSELGLGCLGLAGILDGTFSFIDEWGQSVSLKRFQIDLIDTGDMWLSKTPDGRGKIMGHSGTAGFTDEHMSIYMPLDFFKAFIDTEPNILVGLVMEELLEELMERRGLDPRIMHNYLVQRGLRYIAGKPNAPVYFNRLYEIYATDPRLGAWVPNTYESAIRNFLHVDVERIDAEAIGMIDGPDQEPMFEQATNIELLLSELGLYLDESGQVIDVDGHNDKLILNLGSGRYPLKVDGYWSNVWNISFSFVDVRYAEDAGANFMLGDFRHLSNLLEENEGRESREGAKVKKKADVAILHNMPTFFDIYVGLEDHRQLGALFSIWEAIEDGGYLVLANTGDSNTYGYDPGKVIDIFKKMMGYIDDYSEIRYVGESLDAASTIIIRKRPKETQVGRADELEMALQPMGPPSDELDMAETRQALSSMRRDPDYRLRYAVDPGGNIMFFPLRRGPHDGKDILEAVVERMRENIQRLRQASLMPYTMVSEINEDIKYNAQSGDGETCIRRVEGSPFTSLRDITNNEVLLDVEWMDLFKKFLFHPEHGMQYKKVVFWLLSERLFHEIAHARTEEEQLMRDIYYHMMLIEEVGWDDPDQRVTEKEVEAFFDLPEVKATGLTRQTRSRFRFIEAQADRIRRGGFIDEDAVRKFCSAYKGYSLEVDGIRYKAMAGSVYDSEQIEDNFESVNKKIGKGLTDAVIEHALYAGKNGDKLMIGIDDSWLPDKGHGMQGLVSAITRISEPMGIKDVIVVYGKGENLAGELKKRAEGEGIDYSNILVFGPEKITKEHKPEDENIFDDMIDPKTGNKMFLVGVNAEKLMEGIPSGQYPYARIVEMLRAAVDAAFSGTEVVKIEIDGVKATRLRERVWLFIPGAKGMDPEDLKRGYEIQKTTIEVAA